jgi:hypothetical protein
LDGAEKQGENGELLSGPCLRPNAPFLWSLTLAPAPLLAQEIANLRREAQAFKSVRAALRSKETSSSAAKMAFQKVERLLPLWESSILLLGYQVFHDDILNLLSMEDMWRFRDKPVPLDFDLIKTDQFKLRGQVVSGVNSPTDGALHPMNGDRGRLNGSVTKQNGSSATPASVARPGHGLRDQRSLSLRENLTLFVSRLVSHLPLNCMLMLPIKKFGASRSAPHRGRRHYIV